MNTRVWLIFILYVVTELVTTELMGDHVCEKEERYTVNATKYVLRNITVRSYEWCVQVPPRCSTYSIQQINDTKIEEEEKIRYVKTCCIDYYEAGEGTKCLPNACRFCKNGYCNEDGICNCDIGFWGNNCDKECVGNTWGVNCENKCIDCHQGHCDVQPENCVCPPKSIRCDLICAQGHQNGDCLKQCNCDSMHICDPFTRKCITVNKNYTEYDYGDYLNYKLIKYEPKFPSRRIYQNFETSTTYEANSHPVTKPIFQNVNVNDINYSTAISVNEESSTIAATRTKEYAEEFHTTNVKIETSTIRNLLVDEESIDATIDKLSQINETVKSPFVNEDKLINSTSITNANVSGNKTKESHTMQTFDESSQRILMDSHLFVIIISGVLFTVLIIMSAAVFCVLYKLKEKKRKYGNTTDDGEEKKINGSISTVSVTARSIFHTPLPDPPIFQNPAFSTPLEGTKQPRTFETHVICNMNFPQQMDNNQTKQDIAELFYDHPPSTGSYRAASIPEPPKSICSKSGFDPIYDEIPCSRRILPARTPPPCYTTEEPTLYMNTK